MKFNQSTKNYLKVVQDTSIGGVGLRRYLRLHSVEWVPVQPQASRRPFQTVGELQQEKSYKSTFVWTQWGQLPQQLAFGVTQQSYPLALGSSPQNSNAWAGQSASYGRSPSNRFCLPASWIHDGGGPGRKGSEFSVIASRVKGLLWVPDPPSTYQTALAEYTRVVVCLKHIHNGFQC